MLPASKNDFPKCLYLDQNKWIDLARAHYGRPEGKPFQDALRNIRSAVESGKLVVPFSWINVVEAIAPMDPGRRERLARFIVELTGNHTLLPETEVCRLELRNALGQYFDRGTPTAIRPLVVRRGVTHALGLGVAVVGHTAEAEVALRHLSSPEATLAFLLEVGGKRAPIAERRAAEARVVGVFERVRSKAASLGPEQRRVVAFAAMFSSSGVHGPDLAALLEDLGLTFEEFTARVASAEDIV
jgi:hypothetical protein